MTSEQQWKDCPERPFGKRVGYEAAFAPDCQSAEWSSNGSQQAAASGPPQPIIWKPSVDAALANQRINLRALPSSMQAARHTLSCSTKGPALPPGLEPAPRSPLPPGFVQVASSRRMLHSAPAGISSSTRNPGSPTRRKLDSAEIGGSSSPGSKSVAAPRAASACSSPVALRLPLLQPWALVATQSQVMASSM